MQLATLYTPSASLYNKIYLYHISPFRAVVHSLMRIIRTDEIWTRPRQRRVEARRRALKCTRTVWVRPQKSSWRVKNICIVALFA